MWSANCESSHCIIPNCLSLFVTDIGHNGLTMLFAHRLVCLLPKEQGTFTAVQITHVQTLLADYTVVLEECKALLAS